MKIGLQPDSPVQNPEKLYRQRGFLAYLVVCIVTFVVLMFTSIPRMYDLFNVAPVRNDAAVDARRARANEAPRLVHRACPQ